MEQIQKTTAIIQKNVQLLTSGHDSGFAYFSKSERKPLPNIRKIKEIMELIKSIIFPEFYGQSGSIYETNDYFIGSCLERLYFLLEKQISYSLNFQDNEEAAGQNEKDLALRFIDRIPEIRRMIYTDVKAVKDGDPAAKNFGEVIYCYPAITCMLHYRSAHELINLDIPVLPRIITEMAHSLTGIDIHPRAKIGEYFSIDHGTGIVVGETCIIGNHVSLYQGVTLGARSFTLDERGLPMDIPRHPIIEDNVIIYSNATVLGRITIGEGAVIGGNIWITQSVPAGCRVVQQRAMSSLFIDGAGI